MSAVESRPPAVATSDVVIALTPLMAVVLVVFLITGIAMPVLPLHVHQELGLGTFVVGLVSGSQFAAALVSRIWSGHFADTRGAKRAVVAGLLAAAASGLLYALSLRFTASPITSVSILIAGRALLGGAESFIITGALSWGLALVATQNAGKVIAWIGTALYAAFAVGAPAGGALYARYGFVAIALATTLVPLLGVLLILPLRGVTPIRRPKPSLATVLRAVLMPGFGLAFSSIGFGAITTFITLLFVSQGWAPAWLGLSTFAAAFMATRIVFGHLPDRIGGAKIALVSVLLEAAGQALIWLAPSPGLALAGAVLSGFGYALVYPGLGLEAVHRVPSQSRGLAMGTYTACLDLALGIASPLLGLIAAGAGLRAVFLASTITVLGAAVVATRLLRAPTASDA
ncbi:arabinose transporter [Rhodoplanes sp. Z2-YC6860]|uniref:arabinose transporter n=1 Tax=Rhodoplanes sp. Z2-YC6860 TaxID=674703 RepID=UPI00078B9942|nr:arabinose transporter [Rhodoplanes sp. Z2-YC6860]AMN43868.1 arabinose efflux permease family protein [Rhodoplanes sp. Z2-YC6860]